ncbi:MAG: hypothetical protein NZ853_03685 [Leptospiraceae bacterium]|nr:hypothetical protein [Leptospiraceae bacterium]
MVIKRFLFFLRGFFPLFILISCISPYKFRNYYIQVNTKKETSETSHQQIKTARFSIHKDKNQCIDFHVILKTPLVYPFVPNRAENVFVENEVAKLLKENFFWIRIYLNNQTDETLYLLSDRIYLSVDQKKTTIVPVEEIIKKYPFLLDSYPVFWYVIPKPVYIYFDGKREWWRNFYFFPLNPEERKAKLHYYAQHYAKKTYEIKPKEEVLFFLVFEKLQPNKEHTYEFHMEFKPELCNVSFQFRYWMELSHKKEDDIIELSILNELRQQNQKWSEVYREKLQSRYYKEFSKTYFDFFE